MQHICTTACLYYLCFRSSSGLTCNTKDGCHETPKHKPIDSGLTSNQPLQQEEEEEEEFTAGQMDPRLKTAGSFRGRQGEREREDDTSYTERRERERERVSGTDARQSGAVFVTNTIDQHVVSSTKLQINTTALCTADGPGHRERGSEREEEAGGSIQIILQLFFLFFQLHSHFTTSRSH